MSGRSCISKATRDWIAEGRPGLEPETLTWATGGPYPREYKRRTAGQFGCDRCWHCATSPAGGSVIWMNCYGDLYCDLCARKLAAAWLALRHPFAVPPFGDTYCSKCGATRDGVQHS